jgi:hypothetical protein
MLEKREKSNIVQNISKGKSNSAFLYTTSADLIRVFLEFRL